MLPELKRIAASLDDRRGWDFSSMRDARDPVPWDYLELVPRYLHSADQVLDLGSGGGEKFLLLAPYFGRGVGIDADPEMVAAARENTPPGLEKKVSFLQMRSEALDFPDETFDVVLNRHSSVPVEQIARVLRPGGILITQQVGQQNTENICRLFGCGPGGEYPRAAGQAMDAIVEAFQRKGWSQVCLAEYNVGYTILDMESLLFWLKAVPIPQDFNLDRHWRQVEQILREYSTPNGIRTNEHRHLLIVKKP